MTKVTIEDQRDKSGFWYSEDVSPEMKVTMRLNSIVYNDEKKSKYQKVDVIDTVFGLTLITDGKSQSAECDEFMYHESLVHPSLLLSGMMSSSSGTDTKIARKVFIGGGGELATAREVLRHSSVERCVMVDLDEEVINVSKKYLPAWGGHGKVCADPRFDLIIGDAHAYLYNTTETFDVIIMDISDPIEAGPGIALYTREFYQHVVTKLSPGGVFVTQAGVADCVMSKDFKEDANWCFAPIKNTLEEVFDCVIPYNTLIPSYVSAWGFVIAFNINQDNGSSLSSVSAQDTVTNFCNLNTETVDKSIEECIDGGEKSLKHYDGCTHMHMFHLVKSLRLKLSDDKRIMTAENPIFMY